MENNTVSIPINNEQIVGYNDGNPMNLNDRNNSLTLDGRSKSIKPNKKGK